MDVTIRNEGSVSVFSFHSPEAKQFVGDNLQLEGWQWLGPNSFAVDHRYVSAIAEGMQEDGLSVGEE